MGFPRKLNSHTIGPVSAMFILTGIVSKALLLESNTSIELIINRLKNNGYSKGNFNTIFNALEEILEI